MNSVDRLNLRICTMASLFALLAVAVSTRAGTQSESELLSIVQSMIKANREGISSIEFDYTVTFGGKVRRCKYAMSGEKQYHASIDVGSDGALSFPMASAWNGHTAAVRPQADYLLTSKDKRQFKPSIPTPGTFVGYYIDGVLGFAPNRQGDTRLIHATRTTRGGKSCIELEFAFPATGKSLKSWHSPDVGYWPVALELRDATGNVVYDLSNVQYESVESDGNKLYYPVLAVAAADGGASFRYEVDVKTLKINQSVSPKKFVFEPSPRDRVWNVEDMKTIRPRDPNWVPGEELEFPFDQFAATGTAVSRSPTSSPSQTDIVAGMFSPETSSRPVSLVIISSSLVLLAAVLWIKRRRVRSM